MLEPTPGDPGREWDRVRGWDFPVPVAEAFSGQDDFKPEIKPVEKREPIGKGALLT